VSALVGASDSEVVRLVAAKRDGALNAISWPARYTTPFEFGSGSAERVAQRVERDGFAVEHLVAPRLALDVDLPQDLSEWLGRVPASNARVLR
jgi:2-phospho-L-lactate guanylyltransferase (CobY/MobA/RfbA family)